MLNFSSRLETLEVKLRKLLYIQQMLYKENEVLKKENKAIKQQLIKAEPLMIGLGEKGTTLMVEQNKELISSKIDEYIAEIDACIELLNQ